MIANSMSRRPGKRVAAEARRRRKRGLVQVCTTVDAWAPTLGDVAAASSSRNRKKRKQRQNAA